MLLDRFALGILLAFLLGTSNATEMDAAVTMGKVWEAYLPMATVDEAAWLDIALPDGRKEKGGQLIHHAPDGKTTALVTLDRLRSLADSALLSRDSTRPLGCSVLSQSSRGKIIDRQDYDAIAGGTSLNYFELCRLVLGDRPQDYVFSLAGDKIVGKPRRRAPGDCEQQVLTITELDGIPVIASAECMIGGRVRRRQRFESVVVRVGAERLWRTTSVLVEDLDARRVTTINAERREFGKVFAPLDVNSLKRGRPVGWVW